MQLGGRPAGPVELSFGGGTSFMRFASPKPKASQFFTPKGQPLP
jgi:hypothetical protein